MGGGGGGEAEEEAVSRVKRKSCYLAFTDWLTV